MADEVKEYSEELQKLFLEFLISNKELAGRCQSLTEPSYFNKRLQPVAELIKTYFDEYSDVPSQDQIKAITQVQLNSIPDQSVRHDDWFLDEYEQFCKYKALEKAILKSADLLEKQQYGTVEKLIKDATQIGLAKTFGTDYFADPKGRLTNLKDSNGQLSTGWKTLDEKLYGGFNRGELNIFAGGSGAGKSLFLQNLALNWAKSGLNGVYFSLELSEGLCSMRMDSMLTGTNTREVYKNIDDVDLKVRLAGKKAGKLQIVQLPNGVTVNDIRSWIKEFQIQHNLKVDWFVVDYLDLMMPAGQKISVADLFIKDKLVSEELRNLATQMNMLLATASQLNRAAVESVEFDHSHIAGGLSKIQTADNVFGIWTSLAMKERGRVQLQFMKTRSSSGVGQKIELGFDPQTLKISDLDPDEIGGPTDADVLYNNLQRKSTTTIDASTGEIKTTPAGPAVSVSQPNNRTAQLQALLRKTNNS